MRVAITDRAANPIECHFVPPHELASKLRERWASDANVPAVGLDKHTSGFSSARSPMRTSSTHHVGNRAAETASLPGVTSSAALSSL